MIRKSCRGAVVHSETMEVRHGSTFDLRKVLVGIILGYVFMSSTVTMGAATSLRSMSDEQIVAQGRLVASGSSVEIYEHGVKVDPSFLKIMESVYEQVETLTSLKLDKATLGPKVRVYVSDSVRVSHVWKGYQHPSDPRGIIFLNLRVYQGAMSGRNATHIHELTHLFTWNYKSHTLREGFADYIALTILPKAAVGPNPGGDEAPPEIPPAILEYLGTSQPPPGWLSSDLVRRRAYYFASYRFVKYLIRMKGIGTFMKLYASENPGISIKELYGISREEAVQAAFSARE